MIIFFQYSKTLLTKILLAFFYNAHCFQNVMVQANIEGEFERVLAPQPYGLALLRQFMRCAPTFNKHAL